MPTITREHLEWLRREIERERKQATSTEPAPDDSDVVVPDALAAQQAPPPVPPASTPTPASTPAAPLTAWDRRWRAMQMQQREEQEEDSQPPMSKVYKRPAELTPFKRTDWSQPLRESLPPPRPRRK